MTLPDRLRSPHVLHVPTGTRCNNRCSFCMERSVGSPVEMSLAEHVANLERLRAELDSVVFTGGEPTLNPLLPELVRAARRLGYRQIGLITNARALNDGRLAEALLAAGLGRVTVSIHGADAATHDAIVRRRGAFAQAVSGVQNLIALRGRYPFVLDVNCTLVRANLGSIRAIRDHALKLGAASVNFNVVEPRGNADDLFDSVVPSYGEVMAAADRSGLDFGEETQSLSRVPLCAGGVEWVQETFHLAGHEHTDVYDPTDGKWKGPLCAECAVADGCDGLWQRYVEGYGHAELVPLVDPATRRGRVLRLATGSPCNNHCEGCLDGPAAAGPLPSLDLGRELRTGWLRGYRRLELAGGELLLGNQAAELVLRARRLGYETVALETNARLLVLSDRFEQLLSLALDEIVVRLNAGDARVHDEMARVPGAFRQTLKGMLRLARYGVPFAVRVRRNARNAASLARARQVSLEVGARRFELTA
jgi:MoaA/NifB/PqqE/SkfB family radical SAM enzyme